MKTTSLILLGSALGLVDVTAEQFTVGDSVYDDIRWGAVTPATVTIYHKTGVATVPLEELPAELQQRVGDEPMHRAW